MFDKDSIISSLSLLTAYGYFVSTIYLVTYWSFFGINILAFVSLADIAKIALFPLLLGSVILILAAFQALSLIFGTSTLVSNDEESSDVWLLKGKISLLVLGFILLLVGGFFFLVGDPAINLALAVSIGIFIGLGIGHLSEAFPMRNKLVRLLVICTVCVLPCFSFGIGRYDARRVWSGKKTTRISTRLIKLSGSEEFRTKELLSNDETLKLIGSTGEYFFFLNETNSATLIFKYEDLYFLEIWRPAE